jgi:hypothetical protein
MLITPSGSPHSSKSSPIFRAVKGVYSAGFKIMVHPAAKAGAILKDAVKRGKFQGIMAATTPTGS